MHLLSGLSILCKLLNYLSDCISMYLQNLFTYNEKTWQKNANITVYFTKKKCKNKSGFVYLGLVDDIWWTSGHFEVDDSSFF